MPTLCSLAIVRICAMDKLWCSTNIMRNGFFMDFQRDNIMAAFCSCHWNLHEFFHSIRNGNRICAIFFCNKCFSMPSMDGFESIMVPLWKSNEQESKKKPMPDSEPNKLIRTKQSAKHEMQNSHAKTGENWTHERLNQSVYGKYGTIESDSSNADSKSMNGIEWHGI